MKKLLFFLFIGLSNSLLAQPILTTANDAALGDNFTYIFVDSTGVTPGIGGAMQTWDFTGVTANGFTLSDSWVIPSSTPYYLNYPTSNIAQVNNTGSGIVVYLYHTQSAADTKLDGIVTDNFGTISDMIYSDTQILRQYPATYNSTISDTYSGQAVMALGPAVIVTYRNGTYNLLADGYGTLITPTATFPNTLRAKIQQAFTDSTVYVGLPIPPIITRNVSTTYFWASADAGDKLYQFYVGYDTTMTDVDTTFTNSVSYQDVTTGINDNTINLKDVIAYPVPAVNDVKIIIPNAEIGVAKLSLFDARGILLKDLEIMMHAVDQFEWIIPVTDLSPGLYLGKVACNDKIWNVKLMK